MVRGTTPIHSFGTSTDLRGAVVYVTYKQGDTTILEKSNKDMLITEDGITIMLTQADTLRFKVGMPVKIQIRYTMPNGVSEASNIINATVDEVLKNGVIE